MSDLAINLDRLFDLVGMVCDDGASSNDFVELDSIVRDDGAARDWYLRYCRAHSTLKLELRAHRAAHAVFEQIGIKPTAVGSREFNVVDVETPASPAPAFLSTAFYGTIGFFSQEILFGMLIATVLIGFGLWIGSLIMVTHHVPIADESSSHVERPVASTREQEPKIEYVGKITGMVDCRWETERLGIRDGGLETAENHKLKIINHKSLVALGDKFALSSGLMEITYDTGAKVILQGPVTYEVESAAGGFLSIGKLTARLDGAKPQAANHKSEILNQKFVVKTPTATVTDLGTEFGVEVSEEGHTTSHVFRGSIEVRSADDAQGSRTIRLSQNESARVEVDQNRHPIIRRIALKADGFTRHMPDPQPVVLLRDTFDNRVDSATYGEAGEYGLNQELSHRQSGLYQRVLYRPGGDYFDINGGLRLDNTQVNHLLCPGKLCLCADHGKAGWVVLNRCFPRDVSVSVELAPVAVRWRDKSRPEAFQRGYNSPNWVALGVRGRGVWFDRSMLPLATDAGTVFLIRPNGNWEYFENGKRTAIGDVPAGSPYRVMMQVVGDRLKIQVNDTPLKLDASGPNGSHTLCGWAAKTTENYLSFGACNAVSLGDCNMGAMPDLNERDLNALDNLTVTTVGSEARAAANGQPSDGKEVPRDK